jgi:FkbM family methyltransferase
MNNLSDKVTMKNIAIADKKGVADIVYSETENAADFVNIGGGHLKYESENTSGEISKQIKTTSLDEDLPDIKNVDWLRMDIEGSEILALRGAKRIINSSPNLKIIMEWSPQMMGRYGNVRELIDEMHRYGFKFYNIPKDDNKPGEALSKDYLLKSILTDVLLVRDYQTLSSRSDI